MRSALWEPEGCFQDRCQGSGTRRGVGSRTRGSVTSRCIYTALRAAFRDPIHSSSIPALPSVHGTAAGATETRGHSGLAGWGPDGARAAGDPTGGLRTGVREWRGRGRCTNQGLGVGQSLQNSQLETSFCLHPRMYFSFYTRSLLSRSFARPGLPVIILFRRLPLPVVPASSWGSPRPVC